MKSFKKSNDGHNRQLLNFKKYTYGICTTCLWPYDTLCCYP